MRRRFLLFALAGLVVAASRETWAQGTEQKLSQAQLDQILAPIALYPDSLLAQTLMAAGYPLEVVDAARWSKANPGLKGDAAVAAVKDKTWDASVKSLVAFPQVLAQMSEHLDWMQKVGDAMLAQQQDVADSIQRLRSKASEAGTLASGKEQKVTTQGSGTDQTIVIEPTDPEVVYVPMYNPNTAYGTWPYADYPPTYYPPPAGYGYGSALARGLLFGIGVATTNALFSNWNWNRGNSYVNVNVNRAVNIDRHFNTANIHNGTWQHDGSHRKGVAYRDASVRQRYGQHVPTPGQRQEFRGRLNQAHAGGGHAPRPANHPNLAQHHGQIGNHPQVANRMQGHGGGQHNFAGRAGGVSHGGGAIRGVGNGHQVNRQATRGRAQQARAQGHPRGGGGGMHHGGGGGHRGGRR
jgi:hypothetical protein